MEPVIDAIKIMVTLNILKKSFGYVSYFSSCEMSWKYNKSGIPCWCISENCCSYTTLISAALDFNHIKQIWYFWIESIDLTSKRSKRPSISLRFHLPFLYFPMRVLKDHDFDSIASIDMLQERIIMDCALCCFSVSSYASLMMTNVLLKSK